MSNKKKNKGALFVVSGPSGVGKSTLISNLLEINPQLQFSVSATTRPIRRDEVDGVDYHFVDTEHFLSLKKSNMLLEWAQVYDNLYGTPKQPIMDAIEGGFSILLDIDVKGAAQIKQVLPDAVLIYILPPSINALENRLRARGTDSEEILRRRMTLMLEQLKGAKNFDYLLVNDNLNLARSNLNCIVSAESMRTNRQQGSLSALFGHQ